MKTPIADFIEAYADSETSRFHMPGHKGKLFAGLEEYDITEIKGADVLSHSSGIIAESEKNAASLFGCGYTFFGTEGSTQIIKAMLMLIKSHKSGASPIILAARNAHKAFIYGCAMLGLEPEWIYPKAFSHLTACPITAEEIEKKLSEMEEKPAAVFITSPDYLGNIADIKGIAEVCKKSDIPLLVDNAHGAYLSFLSPSGHPIALGAAMCCDSAHKTLPALTGAAYLHISEGYKALAHGARSALATFSSTSPSYLTLRSLDLLNAYLADDFPKELSECIKKIDALKLRLASFGIEPEKTEPLKITINAHRSGLRGNEIEDILRENGIEAEFCDDEYIVLMASPKNTQEDFDKLSKAFEKISPKSPIISAPVSFQPAKKIMSLREALLSPFERLPIEKAQGRICAMPSVSCPPAVPIVISGELIEERHIAEFKRYGIESVDVVIN